MNKEMVRAAAVGSEEQDTRARVLAAAAELFATRGYAGTSISAIRKKSGVLPSSIYWEFGSKEGIFASVIEDSTQRWFEESTRAVARIMHRRGGMGPDILAPFFEYMAQSLADPPDGLRLALIVAGERREGDERILEIIRYARMRAVEGGARLLAAAGLVDDPKSPAALDTSRLAMACFDGAVVAAQIDADAGDLRRILALLYAALTALAPPNRATRPNRPVS
jgi:AcrR family transcriptional regulator